MLAEDQKGNTELLAYCWLIYDWENLLWLCPTCARLKGNRFFIQGKRGSPTMPVKELHDVENALMLDPCHHDPILHLRFALDGSVGHLTEQGKATIAVLDLNRSEIIEDRRQAITHFAALLAQGRVQNEGGVLIPKSSSEPPPQRGAVTLALLDYARVTDFDGLDVDTLVQYLNSLSDADRAAFAS